MAQKQASDPNGVACIFPPPGRARPTPRGRRSDAGKSSLNPKEQGAHHLTRVLRSQDNDSVPNSGRLAESPGPVLDDIEDEDMESPSENDENDSVDRLLQTTPTNLDHEAFVLGYDPPSDSPSSPHPSPSEIPFYWQTFVENVDPLIKIFHIPSMSKLMREIQRNIGSLSRSEDALMFAIYLAAVTSMTPNEARDLLGKDKETLVAQYRLATKKALARADFMSSSDLMTLQAIVLFLFCLRESDQSKFTWTMTALVVRIAQGLGIHRVRRGTELSPYDTEISLRLWLSIWLLDLRTALDQGTKVLISEDLSDPVLPLNINDSDLDPANVAYPPSRTGMTDMAPTLIKYETGLLMKKLAQPDHGRNLAATYIAWNAIDLAIGCWGCPTQQQDELWKPLMKLAKKATKKREANGSLFMQDSAAGEDNQSDQPMSVDWTLANLEVPLWPTEISPGYLYEDMGEDFLAESGGSPSEVLDYML
ncbi:hypothetical protein G7Z17_g2437 [Cylindrodendrum hubeiense]|uniref:Xylanolytic transcriptional activator regulatory domain-containing protein n=1 Tax=Cylindrodendrum hubeiense TaxID=595255 RepID=A0A9P5HGK1_9HYPO|nr:hypothetical protein G7Z17_g2437 [Cylindrodendrum hubeiense]